MLYQALADLKIQIVLESTPAEYRAFETSSHDLES